MAKYRTMPGGFEKSLAIQQMMKKDAPTVSALGVNGGVYWDAASGTMKQIPGTGPKVTQSAELQLLEQRFGKGTPEYNKALDALIAKHSYIADSTEKAPTLGEVVDPTDPTRMLKIDARTYRGGSLGAPGVIGVAGKEPGAAARIAREEVKATAKSDAIKAADDIIASLNGYYNTLEKEGGITSVQKGVIPNIGSYIGSSGLGQVVGGAVGTRAQSARDSITQTRPLLLSTLKDALGLTAQQLNSDKELTLWLSAATDPKMSIEANRDALKNIAKRIGVKASGGWSITPVN
jgi:hypothetical protein